MSNTANPKEIKALISFLDETDEQILETIQEKLFLMGRTVLPFLEDTAHATLNETSNNRIRTLINRIRRKDVSDEFSAWLKEDSSDLLKAYIIISKLQYPDLDEEELTIEVEQMRMDAWLELNDNLTALENVKVLNHIFFQVHHFEGNKEKANVPEEQLLPAVLRSRKGNALSLGILYLIIAGKLKLP
ncbi:MAG TPA: transglutaminase family protein, partial [Bacteroidales bacterium]|nr:transglutaminase family protein [Bacteroidales bacterium]